MITTPAPTQTAAQRLKEVLTHPAGYTYLLTNLMLLVGLLFLGWDGETVVAAYFTETIIIGAFNLPKLFAIYFLNPQRDDIANQSPIKGLVVIPAFIIIFSLFIFVQLLIFLGFQNFGHSGSLNPFLYLKNTLGIHATTIIGNFVIGQMVILITVFIAGQQYKTTSLQRQMFSPFARMFVQQVVVIISGFVIISYHNNKTAPIILIVFKTFIDLIMQQVELHKRNAQMAVSNSIA